MRYHVWFSQIRSQLCMKIYLCSNYVITATIYRHTLGQCGGSHGLILSLVKCWLRVPLIAQLVSGKNKV